MKRHQVGSEDVGRIWLSLFRMLPILMNAVMALAFLLGVTCGAEAGEITLRQDFEDFAVDASGDQGDPDDVGGRFGPLKPTPAARHSPIA